MLPPNAAGDPTALVFTIQTAGTNGSGVPLSGGRVATGAYPDTLSAFRAIERKSHVDLAWYGELPPPEPVDLPADQRLLRFGLHGLV